MKNVKPSPVLSFVNPPVSLPVTSAQLRALGIPQAAIDSGEFRGTAKTRGPWGVAVSFRALCVSSIYGPANWGGTVRLSETIHGMRILSPVNGFCNVSSEGRVSVKGRKVRGFTSSQLFTVTDKTSLAGGEFLFNCATIHACGV